MSEPRSVAQLLHIGERVLTDSSHVFEDHDFAAEAEELLAFVLDVDRDELEDSYEPPRRSRDRYLSLIARRAAGEPFPFLTGRIEFYGLELSVRPGAFVPRPSSELTVERALRRLRRRPRPAVVDVCTGSGPIALGIAHELPDAEVWGADIDPRGLEQARHNARRLGIENVVFRRGDMYDALPKRLRGTIDLITAHVPYIPSGEIEDLPSEVKDFEPLYTLTDESFDGTFLMRSAISGAPEWLRPGGWLLLEMSDDMVARARRLCRKVGLEYKGAATDADELSTVVEARA